MMQRYCFTFRSITAAMQAQTKLKQAGIGSVLRRAPAALRTNGCGYCLLVERESFQAAESVLPDHGYQKIFRHDGTWQEVRR